MDDPVVQGFENDPKSGSDCSIHAAAPTYCGRHTDLPKLGFVTDEDGQSVGSNRLKNMSETAKKLWAHLHHYRLAPATWRLISQQAYEYYSNSMRAAFVEFRFCDNDWKVSLFGSIRFPDWSNGPRASGKLTR